MKGDNGAIWLTNITNVKINMKEGYEESTAINGITYCHPKGKDPELINHQLQEQRRQEKYAQMSNHYNGRF